MYLFVLNLENNKWYVGKSPDPEKTIARFFEGKGTLWTQLHKPVRVYRVDPLEHLSVTDITIRFMAIYGRENVRGGAYSQRVLPPNTPAELPGR